MTTIALSHGGTTTYTSTSHARHLMVGTTQGIVHLEQSDQSGWRETGGALEGEHIHAFVHEPQSGLWFAAAYRSGVFASADDGRTWELRNTGLTETSAFSLAVVPRSDGRPRLYVGTEPAHLFFSDDLGEHWTEQPDLLDAPSRPSWRFAAEPFAAHVKHINAVSGHPSVMYVSVEVGGLHKSTDGGMTFRELSVPHLDVHRTVIDPRDPQRVYVTGGAGVILTTDGGETWETLLPRESAIGRYPDMLVQLPSDPESLVLCASEYGPRSWVVERRVAGGQVARSADGGRTWVPCMGGLPSDRFNGSVEALCVEDVGGSISLFCADTDGTVAWSADGGKRWQVIAQTAPVSKSVHAEMARGGGPTPLKFSDAELYVDGVKVAV